MFSVLDLQSFNDVPGALIQMRRALKPDGFLLACLFAGDTLTELRQSWLAAEAAVIGRRLAPRGADDRCARAGRPAAARRAWRCPWPTSTAPWCAMPMPWR